MAEHYQQRRGIGKNLGRESEDPRVENNGIESATTSRKPHHNVYLNGYSSETFKANETVVGRKPIGAYQPKENCGK